MPNITKDLGPVTGYAIAVEHGYTGTEAEWIAEVLRGTQNAQTATEKAAEAAASERAAAESADDASDSADSAQADALKAEGNAVGKQNDVDVVDGPYYHNNAKYYAEQAEASKRAAASSETAAGTAAAAAQEWAGQAAASTDTLLSVAYERNFSVFDYGEIVHGEGLPANTLNGRITKNNQPDLYKQYCRTGAMPLKAASYFLAILNDSNFDWRIGSYTRPTTNTGSTNNNVGEFTDGGYQLATSAIKIYSRPQENTEDGESTESYAIVSFRRHSASESQRPDLTEDDYATIAAKFKLLAVYPLVPQTFQSVQNSSAAVKHITNIAETYIGRNDLHYGAANLAFNASTAPQNGKHNMNCSEFVMLCLRGTPYEKSRYVTYNSEGDPGNGENGIDGGYIFDASTTWHSTQRYGGGGLLAHQMAKYALQHGYLYKIKKWPIAHVPDAGPVTPEIYCDDIRPGDVLFRLDTDDHWNYWMHIYHCMLVVDADEKYIYCYESLDATVDEDRYTPVFRQYEKSSLLSGTVYYGARFPLAERGYVQEASNIANCTADNLTEVDPEGESPGLALTVEDGAVTIAGTYEGDPVELRVPVATDKDGIYSYGIEELNITGVSVCMWETSDGEPTAKAKSPDNHASTYAAYTRSKCYLDHTKSYALVISVTSVQDLLTITPYVMQGVTYNGWAPYTGEGTTLAENVGRSIV